MARLTDGPSASASGIDTHQAVRLAGDRSVDQLRHLHHVEGVGRPVVDIGALDLGGRIDAVLDHRPIGVGGLAVRDHRDPGRCVRGAGHLHRQQDGGSGEQEAGQRPSREVCHGCSPRLGPGHAAPTGGDLSSATRHCHRPVFTAQRFHGFLPGGPLGGVALREASHDRSADRGDRRRDDRARSSTSPTSSGCATDFALVAVGDPSPAARAFVADTFGVPAVANRRGAAGSAARCRRRRLARRAASGAYAGGLRRGLHVLCEKPLCYGTEDIDRLIAARDRAGRVGRSPT